MPKILSYTPPWLCRPSAGAKIFSNPEPQSPASPSKKRTSYFNAGNASQTESAGPRRLIATRGTEVFTVVGNKIRWADLSVVKDEWEERKHNQKQDGEQEAYRTLTTPVYYQITQLIISPSGTFLAICTEHTVHVAVLPDRSRLVESDRSPLKLKTYQLGPTTHVIPESPLVSVLWHPLAASTVSADCLVTVTAEAAVRVWELDRANQWSFERASLAIDLRKLADGVSCEQDFEPSGFGKTRGFSVDAFDMEASAAAFGGQGTPDEDGWAGMTLWTAMSNGDVYALCPLLPSNWRPTATTIPSLSVSSVSKVATIDAQDTDADSRRAAEQQYEWVQQLDDQSPTLEDVSYDDIRQRPQDPSAIPRLQGPFELGSNGIDDGEITDIHVIAARLDEELLLSGEDDFELVSEGLQFTTVCLATDSNNVHVALELEGISGQWLPKKGRGTFSVPTSESSELVLLHKVSIGDDDADQDSSAWPTFTADPTDAYNVYTTSSHHMFSLSLSDWAARVGIEVDGSGDVDSGLQTRLAVACQSQICNKSEIYKAETPLQNTVSSSLSAPGIINDINLGHILVSCLAGEACAVIFDQNRFSQSTTSLAQDKAMSPFRSSVAFIKALEDDIPEPIPTRAPYAPANTFYLNQMAPYTELKNRLPSTRKPVLNDKPLRLSPACLDIMTLAHRTFSQQTSHVEKAAAELFRRCERLREELADQVKQMSELADRLQHIKTGSESVDGKQNTFDERLSGARERQQKLVQRYEALRRKSGRVGSSNRELSSKEQVWANEIEALATKIGLDIEGDIPDQDDPNTVIERHATVRSLTSDLITQSQQVTRAATQSPTKDGPGTPGRASTNAHRRNESTSFGSPSLSISSRLQRERIAEVMSMVDREGAIIEGVLSRLSKLNVG